MGLLTGYIVNFSSPMFCKVKFKFAGTRTVIPYKEVDSLFPCGSSTFSRKMEGDFFALYGNAFYMSIGLNLARRSGE